MEYADFVKLAPRFTRAVNLERDATVPAAVDGYIVTTTAQEVLSRFIRALADPSGHRAWTVTGPYGSGKSAFALFLANLLGPSDSSGCALARSILKSQSDRLYLELFDRRRKITLPRRRFCPVLINGSQEPLVGALLRACVRDVRRYFSRGRPIAALKDLERLYVQFQKGRSVASSEAVAQIAEVALHLQQSGGSQGILLIVDELGNVMEFAVGEPDRGDVYVLQQLAEATAQFKSPGVSLGTILHRAFERYAVGLRPTVREEWSKVQGRFEDIAFQEPPDQLIDILAHAIQHEEHPLSDVLERRARKLGQRAFQLGLAPRSLARGDFVKALVHCSPLHPIAVLALISLCRKLGQNQRSLFAFLVSREPHGFSSFLHQEVNEAGLSFYGLANLYDYAAHALGSGLAIGEGATRWAEVQSALDRCASLSPTENQLVKAVGTLAAIGAYGNFKPSRDVIEFAFGWDRSGTRKVCAGLLQRSVIIHRKHNDSLAFWEGSDVDIDALIQEAKLRLSEGTTLARRLAGRSMARALVAKRHSFQTGTLRYFSVRLCSLSEISQSIETDGVADAPLIFCLPP